MKRSIFSFSKILGITLLISLCIETKALDSKQESATFYNPSVNLNKECLKVLDIGNSFTHDATQYLPEILRDLGIDTSDMCLYAAVRSGASYRKWYDIFTDSDNKSYDIYKVVGGVDINTKGTAEPFNGEQFRNILKNNVWDIIIIHQSSSYSPYYECWNSDENGGYLDELLSIIRKNQPQATIGFMLVHSSQGSYPDNTEKSTSERWHLIAQSALKMQEEYGMSFIIPYGTAIESLRVSKYNNAYDLTEDGLHLSAGLAKYTAACAYYQALFAPRYGKSILGNQTRIQFNSEHGIQITDENAYVAQLSAIEAVRDYTVLAKLVLPENINFVDNINMIVGESHDLCKYVMPENAIDKSLKVISSDENIVSVNPNGTVTAITSGKCKITAITYNGISRSCTVTVSDVSGIEGIIIDYDEDNAFYDVYGRNVQYPSNGMYVHKGKKIYIK